MKIGFIKSLFKGADLTDAVSTYLKTHPNKSLRPTDRQLEEVVTAIYKQSYSKTYCFEDSRKSAIKSTLKEQFRGERTLKIAKLVADEVKAHPKSFSSDKERKTYVDSRINAILKDPQHKGLTEADIRVAFLHLTKLNLLFKRKGIINNEGNVVGGAKIDSKFAKRFIKTLESKLMYLKHIESRSDSLNNRMVDLRLADVDTTRHSVKPKKGAEKTLAHLDQRLAYDVRKELTDKLSAGELHFLVQELKQCNVNITSNQLEKIKNDFKESRFNAGTKYVNKYGQTEQAIFQKLIDLLSENETQFSKKVRALTHAQSQNPALLRDFSIEEKTLLAILNGQTV